MFSNNLIYWKVELLRHVDMKHKNLKLSAEFQPIN